MTTPDPAGLRLRSPAKINLHLRVLGRRPDGFHDIETLMVPVTVYDTVEVCLAESGISLTCSRRGIPIGHENLAVRAAALFLREMDLDVGVRIHLEKHIPAGAGLGGGSGNAAAVLTGLNRLTRSDLPPSRLEEMAAHLGSDIPWFIRAQPACCRGRGERLEQAPTPPPWPILLVKPPFSVETPWAYNAWNQAGRPHQAQQTLEGIPLHNDLEPPVFEKFTVLPILKSWLEAQPAVRTAAMTGSGSTLFAVLQNASHAQTLIQNLRAFAGPPCWIRSCRIAGPRRARQKFPA